jgi:hypothetical protein
MLENLLAGTYTPPFTSPISSLDRVFTPSALAVVIAPSVAFDNKSDSGEANKDDADSSENIEMASSERLMMRTSVYFRIYVRHFCF